MKCPHCQKMFTQLRYEVADAAPGLSNPRGPTFHSIAFCCPMCSAVLSAQVDPLALKADTVNELFKRLRS